jgi:Glycosyl transferase family 2
VKYARPDDPARVAAVVANILVVSVDDGVRAANAYYWHWAQDLVKPVTAAIAAHRSPELSAAAALLLREPHSPAAWTAVRDLVAALLAAEPDSVEELCDAAWTAVCRSRLDYHLGERYDAEGPLGGASAQSLAAPSPARSGPDPLVLVVIPFRDRSTGGERARNLMACLRSLRDQTMEPERCRVCVVESDDRPRRPELILGHADDYLFAEKAGAFNKCWAVNAGVVNTAPDAPLICVLDADSLVDRDFLRRNGERFQRAGTGAFIPFRDLLYLDARSSQRAIEERCVAGRPEAPDDALRAVVVHRPPGMCMWLRRDVFESVNGMDERCEGWGREDLEFVLRRQLATALPHFDDPMLHLNHPPSAQLVDGQTVNAHLPFLSWAPTEPIGRLDRFARGTAR